MIRASLLVKSFSKFFSIFIPTILIIICFVLNGCVSDCNGKSTNVTSSDKTSRAEDFSVHFLGFTNNGVGDCTYINYGDIDILIDAHASSTAAGPGIKNYVKDYMKDKKFEYVIVTHAHNDHYTGFTGANGVFSNNYGIEIGTIIEFPKYIGTLNNDYKTARNNAIANGAKWFTALECYNNVKEGAQRIYDFGGGVRMEILYNYYYENDTNNENNNSICIVFHQGDDKYLFTGDLEIEGENELVDYYENLPLSLGKCILYKAGHHGSYTASGDKLLNFIQPDYVMMCTCMATAQYTSNLVNQMPSQLTLDRIAKHTDNVYITSDRLGGGNVKPLNGNIKFKITNGQPTVTGSNNSLKLKDQTSFLSWIENSNGARKMPNEWK